MAKEGPLKNEISSRVDESRGSTFKLADSIIKNPKLENRKNLSIGSVSYLRSSRSSSQPQLERFILSDRPRAASKLPALSELDSVRLMKGRRSLELSPTVTQVNNKTQDSKVQYRIHKTSIPNEDDMSFLSEHYAKIVIRPRLSLADSLGKSTLNYKKNKLWSVNYFSNSMQSLNKKLNKEKIVDPEGSKYNSGNSYRRNSNNNTKMNMTYPPYDEARKNRIFSYHFEASNLSEDTRDVVRRLRAHVSFKLDPADLNEEERDDEQSKVKEYNELIKNRKLSLIDDRNPKYMSLINKFMNEHGKI
jgi:hypothetical protein